LDKLTRKQLKIIEIAGNKLAKEYFQRVGVPFVGDVYDYANEKVTKFKNDLANKVKEILGSVFENVVKVEEKKKTEFEKNEKMFDEIIENKEITKESSTFQNFTHEREKKSDFKVAKTNKIKKVDIDFDFDNFNPGFDSNAKIENKFNENNNFNVQTKEPKDTSNDVGSDFKKKFANKKAISSEDYAENNVQDSSIKSKLSSMKGQTAISSDELFGTGNNEEKQKSLGSTLKDYAIKFTLNAADKAKDLKDKTKNLINSIQSKYQNN